MTNRTIPGGQFIKFDVSPEQKARFVEACQKLGLSQAAMLRAIVAELVEEAEREAL